MCRDPGNAVLNRQKTAKRSGFIIRQKEKHTTVKDGCETTCVYSNNTTNNTNNFPFGPNIY